MKLNAAKCCTMSVSFARNLQHHEILLINDTQLENVHYVKVLGVIIQDNLKWDRHVNEIIKKCNRKLYMLRCLRSHNLPVNDLLAIYKGYVRPVLDYCVPLFNGNLTKEQVNKLERIQKRVCRIIFGKNYSTYREALNVCKLETLENRRDKLCSDFAYSIESHHMCRNWLPPHRNCQINLRHTNKYDPPRCKTVRYKQSAIPQIVSLLNAF